MMTRYPLFVRATPDAMYTLDTPSPAGPTIATYAGTAVLEAVIDRFGHRYTYAGIAPRRSDGQPDVTALRSGEFLAGPGIIYRRDSQPTESDDAVQGDGEKPHDGRLT